MSTIFDEIKQWVKEHWKSIISSIAVGFGFIGIILVSSFYGLIAAVAKETMLKSVIEAEATIFGFFGLIIVYALTSLDNRVDRLEQQLFDVEEKYLGSIDVPKTIPKTVKDKIANLNNRLRITRKKRKNIIENSILVGSYLILSLLISILALGMPDVELAFFLCFLSIGLLFTSIVFILVIFYKLAKSPETCTHAITNTH